MVGTCKKKTNIFTTKFLLSKYWDTFYLLMTICPIIYRFVFWNSKNTIQISKKLYIICMFNRDKLMFFDLKLIFEVTKNVILRKTW